METRGQDGDMPLMKGLVACENKLKADGYKEDFQVTKQGLSTYNNTEKHYGPDQVKLKTIIALKALPILATIQFFTQLLLTMERRVRSSMATGHTLIQMFQNSLLK